MLICFDQKNNSVDMIYGQLLVLRSYLSTIFTAPSAASKHSNKFIFKHFTLYDDHVLQSVLCDWHLAIFTHFYTPQLGLNTPSSHRHLWRQNRESICRQKPNRNMKIFCQVNYFSSTRICNPTSASGSLDPSLRRRGTKINHWKIWCQVFVNSYFFH